MHRRRFLAGAGCAGVTALAGCAGVLDDGDEGGDGDESIRTTTRWATPATTDESLAGYRLRSAEPAGILQANDGIAPEDVAARLEDRSLVQRHLDVTTVERFVEVAPVGSPPLEEYVVYEGDFDAATVIEALGSEENVDVRRVRSHGEFDLYDSGTGFAAHAVGEGMIVEADRLRNEGLEPADLEVVVDAATGESDRITDQHDGLQATAGRLERSNHLGLTVEEPEQSTETARSQFAGAVASGNAAEIDGEQMELRTVVAFESEQAREAAPIDRWIESGRVEASGEVSETIDGRFVEVTTTVPTADLYG